MQCTNPVLIKNPNISETQSLSYRLAEGSGKAFGFYVPCGKCMGCRIAKTREWTTRLLHEKEICGESCFLTLTYDDDHLPPDSGLHKEDFQKFIKRFRKEIPKKIRYFGCGEYGDRLGRPHYHIVILGWEPPVNDLVYACNRGTKKYYSSGLVVDKWPYGFNIIGTVTKESAQYVTGYIRKKLNGKLGRERYGDLQPPFQLQSQGIGLSFARLEVEKIKEEGCISTHYGTSSLPRYYRRKLGEEGLLDADTMSSLSKNAAVQVEGIVHDYYAEAGFSEHDGLLTVLAARKISELKNIKRNINASGGILEDYV